MTPEQLSLDQPNARPTDPLTSHEAAQRPRGHDEWLRGQIVSFLAALWRECEGGATDDQLQACVFPDERPGSVSKRRLETRGLELVSKFDPRHGLRHRRLTRSRSNADVWWITVKGLGVAEKWVDGVPSHLLANPSAAANVALGRVEFGCPDPRCDVRFESRRGLWRHLIAKHAAKPLVVSS